MNICLHFTVVKSFAFLTAFLQLSFSLQIYFDCSQWLIRRLPCLSLLLFGSWDLDCACCSSASFGSAAKRILMAILELLIPSLLFFSYASPLRQCNKLSLSLLSLCSIDSIWQPNFYSVVPASDASSSTLVKGGFVVVQQKHWTIFYTKRIPRCRNCKMCQIILPQPSKLQLIKFFYLLISKLILTTLKQNLIPRLAPLLMKQKRIRKT